MAMRGKGAKVRRYLLERAVIGVAVAALGARHQDRPIELAGGTGLSHALVLIGFDASQRRQAHAPAQGHRS